MKNKLFLFETVGNVAYWVAAIFFFFFIKEYDEIGEVTNPMFPDYGNLFTESIKLGIIFGIVFTFVDRLFRSRILKRQSYLFKVIASTIVHVINLTIIILIDVVLKGLIDPSELDNLPLFLSGVISSKTVNTIWVYSASMTLLLIVLNEMRDMYGKGFLWKIISGKYHNPKEEERIIMFLDLAGSTTLAEKLGGRTFTELIQDCFIDVAEVVEKFNAEVYQYVGDEVILTWSLSKGLNKNKAFHAFFAYRDLLQNKSMTYLNKYKTKPIFRAGMHMGIVTVAEIGQIKKEISYMGDVINTTARIQAKCSALKQNFLVSSEMVHNAAADEDLSFEFMEEEVLKGKSEKTRIYAVKRL